MVGHWCLTLSILPKALGQTPIPIVNMLEAVVQFSLEVEIIQTVVPTPGEGEILIKVICSGVNPKGTCLALAHSCTQRLILSDWKSVVYSNKPSDSGDDIAGIVEHVGGKVVGFQVGQRVAASSDENAAWKLCGICACSGTHDIPSSKSFVL